MSSQIEQGYFRGDCAAARYLSMDRKTFARLVKVDGPKPIIRGGFRYWSRARLDAWMTAPAEASAYTVRPNLVTRNRARAAKATGINNQQQEKKNEVP